MSLHGPIPTSDSVDEHGEIPILGTDPMGCLCWVITLAVLFPFVLWTVLAMSPFLRGCD